MNSIEEKVKQENAKAAKIRRVEARLEKIEKVVGTFKDVSDSVKAKVTKIRNNIEEKKVVREQAKQEAIRLAQVAEEKQRKNNENYTNYIEFAEANKDKIGSFERLINENGDQIDVVYTELGPLMKITQSKRCAEGLGQVYYEGFAPVSADKGADVEYSKLSDICTKTKVNHNPNYCGDEEGYRKVYGYIKRAKQKNVERVEETCWEVRLFSNEYDPGPLNDRLIMLKNSFEMNKKKAVDAQQRGAEVEGKELLS